MPERMKNSSAIILLIFRGLDGVAEEFHKNDLMIIIWICQSVLIRFPSVSIVDIGGALQFTVVFRIGFGCQFVKPLLCTIGRDAQSLHQLLACDGMVLSEIVVKEGYDLFTRVGLVQAGYPSSVFVPCGSVVLERFNEAGVRREGNTLHLHIVGLDVVGVGEVRLDGIPLLVLFRLQAHLGCFSVAQ